MATEDAGTGVPPSGRRARRQQEIRQRLLAAGRAVFTQVGVSEATIAQITQHADIGFGTFYLYFPTKEALYRAVVQQGFAELGAHLDLVLQQAEVNSDPWRTTVAAGVSAYFRFAVDRRDLFALMFIGPDQGATGMGGEMRARVHHWAATVVRAAVRAESGEERLADEDLADILTVAVIATLRRTAVRWLRAHADETDESDHSTSVPAAMVAQHVAAFISAGLAGAIAAGELPGMSGASTLVAGSGSND